MAAIIGQRWEVYPFAEVSGSVPKEGELVNIRHPQHPGDVISLMGNGDADVAELYEKWNEALFLLSDANEHSNAVAKDALSDAKEYTNERIKSSRRIAS